MNTCKHNDAIVVFLGRNCPYCDTEERLASARTQITDLQTEIEDLRGELEDMTAELETLTEETAE